MTKAPHQQKCQMGKMTTQTTPQKVRLHEQRFWKHLKTSFMYFFTFRFRFVLLDDKYFQLDVAVIVPDIVQFVISLTLQYLYVLFHHEKVQIAIVKYNGQSFVCTR